MVARAGYNSGYLDTPTPQVVVKPQIDGTFEVPITGLPSRWVFLLVVDTYREQFDHLNPMFT